MTKVPRDELARFISGELPDADCARIEQLIETDAETAALYEQLILGDITRCVTAPPTQTPSESQPADVDPRMLAFLRQEMKATRSAEHWSLLVRPGEEPWQLLDDRSKVQVDVVRLSPSASTGGCSAFDSPCVERSFPVTMERAGPTRGAASSEVPTFLFRAGDFPRGYRLHGVRLSQFDHLPRTDLQLPPLSFRRLQRRIDDRPQLPRSNQAAESPRTVGTLAADSGTSLKGDSGTGAFRPARRTFTSGDETRPDFEARFDPHLGQLFVRATMPAHRQNDVVVVEMHYTTTAGGPALRRAAVRLEEVRTRQLPGQLGNLDYGASDWALFVPDLDDHATAEVTLRFRSLRDQDLYLLTRDEIDQLRAEQDSTLLPARLSPDGYQFQARGDAVQRAAADPATCWTLQVVSAEEGGSDV